MWKYTHTDEMYHSLTSRNDSTELYHSDTYLGQDFSDGIKHFKYLFKRKGPNGKWKYYYKKTDSVSLTKKGIRKSSSIYEKTSGSQNNRYGTYEHTDPEGTRYVHKVVKGNRLFSKTSTEGAEFNRKGNITKVHQKTEVGLARQGADKVVSGTKKTVKAVKKKVNKSVAKGKKAVNKALKKAFPETHTSKTYYGDKVETTKSVNGKVVSKTTEKNKLTEKVKKRYQKEAEREKKKEELKKKIKKAIKR